MKIDTILNSDFFKDEILDYDKETEELKQSGWSRKDISEMANFVIKHKK